MVVEELLGVARMTAITLSGHGRINHWDETAEDLFGASRLQAVGRPLGSLLRLPREHRGAFEPGIFGHVWCGACILPRADTGELTEIGWWVYPIEAGPVVSGPVVNGPPANGPAKDGATRGGPGGHDVRLLALAADLRRLREEGPGVTLGDLIVVPPDDGARRSAGTRLLRVEPALTTPDWAGSSAFADRFTARLVRLLPALEPAAAGRIAARVLGLGCPAVSLGLTVRMPIAPHGAASAVPAPRSAAAPAPHRETGWTSPPGDSRPDTSQPLAGPEAGDGWEAMAVREPLAYLGEAGQEIGSSLDHLQTARKLAEVLVPRLADFAAVELLERVVTDSAPPSENVDETAQMRRVAVVHNDESGRWEDLVPEGEPLLFSPATPFVRAMKTGRPVHIPHIGPERAAEIAASFGDRDLRPLFADRELLIVPLIARGRVLGTFKMLRKPGRPGFGELCFAMVEELARRAALCIDNGRLYRREVQAAEELQHSMLPDDPPDVAGARVRYRYRPAGQAANVGGDWFDAIPLPGCRLGIVVGDVMGHGLTSAAIMGQMRTAVRTLAAEDMRPSRLLRQLDGLARRLGKDYLATCMYAVYDPVERRCTLSNAGHVPPVLVSAYGESRVLSVPSGVPIGVGGEPFETVEVPVEDGSQLVLCTDGLLERRDRDIEAGLEELRGRLAGVTSDLDGTCDLLLDTLADSTPADDIAIVAVGFDGIPKDGIAAWERLEPRPSTVPQVRAEVAARLADWRLEPLTDTVELLVSELVTNALVHGAGSIGLRMIKAAHATEGGCLLCEVYDDGADLPRLRHADATDESGRGLQLVSHLAARWGTHRTERGKVVWFEHLLPGRHLPG